MSRPHRDLGGLTPELLLRAYTAGIFPMSESRDDPNVFWVDPKERGVLPLDRFHVPRSLRKVVRKGVFQVKCDTAFEQVVDLCSEPTADRQDSWINPPIRNAMLALFDLGFAHSVECWQNDDLVGGLYGVSLRAAFFGESMCSRKTDASKVALVHLVARLRLGGYKLLDAQFTTDHLNRFGCEEWPARTYLSELERVLGYQARFPVTPGPKELKDELERLMTGPRPPLSSA